MRSVLALVASVAVCAVFAVRYLPHGEAKAAEITLHTPELKGVSFSGGPGIPFAALRDVMESKLGEAIDDAQLERDRVSIERELATRGYLAAKVSTPSVTFARDGGTYIVFDVERGPLFKLRTIEIVGPNKSHAGVITLTAGDDALGDRISRAGQAITDTLSRHGKPSHVEIETVTDPISATVDVKLVTH